MGFVPRPMAQYLAPDLDSGTVLTARVASASIDVIPVVEIEITAAGDD
jgi:hypothetical protein